MPYRIVMASLLVTLLAGCSETPPAASRDNLFLTRMHQTPAGDKASYVVFVPPHRKPDEKLPVILFLNGWGENGDDGLRQISNNFGGDVWRMRASFPFLAVCPQCAYNSQWEPHSRNAEIALAVLDEAIREFNGDPDRVAITGASRGGDGALKFAVAYPDRFSAAIPVSTYFSVPPEKVAATDLPVWGYFNTRDSAQLVRAVRLSRVKMLAAGLNPLLTEYPQIGHNAWDGAYSSIGLYQWLLQVTSRPKAPAVPFQLLSTDHVLTHWEQHPAGRWQSIQNELICPAPEDDSLLISPVNTGAAELSMDVRFTAGEPVLIQLRSDERPPLEFAFRLVSNGDLTLMSEGRLLQRGDHVGQRALRPNWNDLRLQRLDGRLKIIGNGWTLFDLEDPLAGSSFQWVLKQGAQVKEGRWKTIRVRPAVEVQP